MTAVDAVLHTEASVLALLRKRHAAKNGMTPEWAYMEQVRNRAGFDATRTADAMALSLWPSRGHELHGYEVKVARSDWKTELANPAKAEVWTGLVDRWWVIAPKGVVLKDEVPASWGYLEVNAAGTKITQIKPAPVLTKKRNDIDRSFLVCLLRAAGAALAHTPDELEKKQAFDEGWKKGHADGLRNSGNWQKLYEEGKADFDSARRAVQEIQTVLGGVPIREWKEQDSKRAEYVAAQLKIVLNSDTLVTQKVAEAERMAVKLEEAAESIRRCVGTGVR